MESFAAIVNGFQPLTIVAKLFILDVYGGLRYAFALQFLQEILEIGKFFCLFRRNRNELIRIIFLHFKKNLTVP